MPIIKTFSENRNFILDRDLVYNPSDCFFRSKGVEDSERKCFSIFQGEDGWIIGLSYFVGVDWINEKDAIYVQPKIDEGEHLTDYLKMLVIALSNPDIALHVEDLYEIKFDKETIEIEQQQDLLTPLLIIHFLKLVHTIVKKGLKKSYYKQEENLHGKVKGKIIIGKNLKKNIFNNKPLNTYCAFQEFGYNSLENRLLKKAIGFIRKYLTTFNINPAYIDSSLRFITPAFEPVSDNVDFNLVKILPINPFYSEYQEAIKVAKIILQKFGYNLNNLQCNKIKTPPFWIDMSKLFELYVLGLLKEKYKGRNELLYHFSRRGNELDFLLNAPPEQVVIDAKYKLVYSSGSNKVNNDDIRQISGYSRLTSVYKKMNKSSKELIDCLIIYPDQENGNESLMEVDLKEKPIEGYVGFYKLAVRLPKIKSTISF